MIAVSIVILFGMIMLFLLGVYLITIKYGQKPPATPRTSRTQPSTIRRVGVHQDLCPMCEQTIETKDN